MRATRIVLPATIATIWTIKIIVDGKENGYKTLLARHQKGLLSSIISIFHTLHLCLFSSSRAVGIGIEWCDLYREEEMQAAGAKVGPKCFGAVIDETKVLWKVFRKRSTRIEIIGARVRVAVEFRSDVVSRGEYSTYIHVMRCRGERQCQASSRTEVLSYLADGICFITLLLYRFYVCFPIGNLNVGLVTNIAESLRG